MDTEFYRDVQAMEPEIMGDLALAQEVLAHQKECFPAANIAKDLSEARTVLGSVIHRAPVACGGISPVSDKEKVANVLLAFHEAATFLESFKGVSLNRLLPPFQSDDPVTAGEEQERRGRTAFHLAESLTRTAIALNSLIKGNGQNRSSAPALG